MLPRPRIVIAGAASGVGKTTVTVGLARALQAKGLRVAVFKCGPDYLDPTYHARAAGSPSHNLDGWMMGRDAVVATFARAGQGSDVSLIEGVMGLFDGASPTGEEGSTAEIAKWLKAPVLLVVDASGVARTIGAIARGFTAFDPAVRIAGIVCNRVGSRGHLDLLREAVSEPPVVGGLPAEPRIAFPERHLGLLTADERTLPEDVLDSCGRVTAEWLDLEVCLRIAREAPALPGAEAPEPRVAGAPGRCAIGIAFDDAFHFYYDDNLRRLERLGARLVRFSPLRDRALPDVDGLYFGGGYPEVYAEALAGNSAVREQVRQFAALGRPIYAECGGLMYLSSSIRTLDDRVHPMVGIIPGETMMSDRLRALGYVEVETQNRSILGPAGLRFRGHQFRYSELEIRGGVERIYSVRPRRGRETFTEGYSVGSVIASYVHAHWASNPRVAEGFVDACTAHGAARE